MSESKFKIQSKIKIVIGLVLIVLIGTLSFYSIILSWNINCQNPDHLIIISKGASAQSVAKLLQEESCIQNEAILIIALTMTMKNRRIFPGRYNLKGISTIGQLVDVITSQSSDRIKVTLIEGWTIEQFADELKKKFEIDSYKFLRLCNNYNFIHSMGIDAPSLEGFLFPDTYIFLKTYTEEDIIQVLVNQFTHNIQELQTTTSSVKINIREIATMASIIQGEAMYEDEMPIISSVYHNRLKQGMLLQADPTIQYIIPGKPRRLYNKDLEANNPYNTYKYRGLPPGPINNPGLAALKAAFKPLETEYLYFVSNGKGRHIFTHTVDEHNQAKLKMKEIRRMKKKF